MTFAPTLRRVTYTAHLTSSVGWVGAVLVFLALAVIGLTSEDEPTVRGAYLVMAPAAWFILVPLAHASLLSGVALSLGSVWGLVRHYWVLLKLIITAVSTVVLMMYMTTFRQMAGVAADPVVELGLVRNPSPLVHAVLALLLLVVATVLGVYKPFGMTPYGARRHSERRHVPTPDTVGSAPSSDGVVRANRSWPFWFAIMALGLLALAVLLHLVGADFRH